MNSTKNVKGNRQIVVSEYSCEAVWKIPDGLDLEDETVVESWNVRYSKLRISYVNGEYEETSWECEPEVDFKFPSELIDNAEPHEVEYDQE